MQLCCDEETLTLKGSHHSVKPRNLTTNKKMRGYSL